MVVAQNLKTKTPALRAGRQNTSGFTLVETLVSLFVLTVAIVGPLSLAFESLKSARTTEAQITAFYLAQEAIEFVKNTRDTNIKNTDPWLQELDPECVNQDCGIEASKTASNYNAVIKAGTAAQELKYNTATNVYEYNGPGQPSGFTRSVRILTLTSYEAEVTVIVSYSVEGVPHTMTLTQMLYDIDAASGVEVPVCGNGFCELFEDATTCAVDCGVGGGDPNDADGDTWPNATDNCWCVPNFVQNDTDTDGVGDVCDWDNSGAWVTPPDQCCDANCGQ